MRIPVRRRVTGVVIVTVSFCVAGFASSAIGQDTGAAPSLEGIQQRAPSFLVHAEPDRPSRDYREGDQLSLNIVSERDAWLYVLYQQADGSSFQIFPNSHQPNNRVQAGQTVQVPARDDLFRWRVGPPFGEELVKVIASEVPLKALEAPALRQKRFNPISRALIKGIALELGAEPEPPQPDLHLVLRQSDFPGAWAETEVPLTTYPADREMIAAGARRYGVFFGVSRHRYSDFERQVTGRSHDLATPARDAQVLDKVLRDVGRLNGTKVFVDEQATRSNLEAAVTGWLPAVSRPGDTVFIYFSGHGGQLADDNGDEADELDEYLVPHDYLGLGTLLAVLEQDELGQLPASFGPLASLGKQLLQNVQSTEEARSVLVRETGVSDDLFGHWLQSLNGREVVVVLDICHAGGFSDREKGQAPAGSERFDFLDQELSRLKDVGQSNSTLLTASSTKELSLVRLEADLSVMTYYLIEAMLMARGPLEIAGAHGQCAAGMQSYFQSEIFQQANRELQAAGREPLKPHRPQLFRFSDHPVLLKP